MHYNVIIFTDTTDNIASIPAIGPYKCAHVLRKHGHSCLVVNHLSEYTLVELEELISKAVSDQTWLVGFSTTFLRSTQVEKIPGMPTPAYPELPLNTVFPQGKDFETLVINQIKKINPKVKFAVGGTKSHPNYSNRNIDYAIIGYGETSMVNLVDHLRGKAQLNKASRNVWGVTVIDDRFASGYDFAREDMLWEPTDVVNHQCLPIEIGRGCVFKCKFCSFPLNGKHTLDFVKGTDLLREELQRNYDLYGITNYQIVDDTFNDHNQKIDMIGDAVKQLNFQPKFWAYTRLDLLHTRPETVQKLHDIGLRAFFFGIETLHPQAGRVVGKGYDFKKSISTIEHIRSNYPDITMHGSFIIGLPHEDVAHVTTTFQRLLSQDIPLHSWRMLPLWIEEPDSTSFNSDFSINFEKYGYKKIGKVSFNVSTELIEWQNEHMSWQQAVDLHNQFTALSRASDNYKLEGSLIFPLSTMGLNINTLIDLPWKDFNFNYIEQQKRPQFIAEYKKKLLNLIG